MSMSSLLEDLKMNDYGITNSKHPSHGADAATKRWVMQEVKDSISKTEAIQSVCDQIKTDIKRIEKGYDATINELEGKVAESKTTLKHELEEKVN